MEGAQLGGQGADARAMGSRIAQGDTAAESASAIASALHVGGTSGKRGGKRCSGRLAEPVRERGRGVVSTHEVGYFQVEVDKIRLSNGDVRPETTWTTHQN